MATNYLASTVGDDEYSEEVDRVDFKFDPARMGLSRREFVQILGAGLIIAVMFDSAKAADPPPPRGGGGGRRGGGGGGPASVAARLHIGKDGVITVMTGKVECGQGARAELTQAAAEELRVSADAIRMIMADTALSPNDGPTVGSRSTPATVPSIRQGAAAARSLLIDLASQRWNVAANTLTVADGKVVHADSKRELTYADLANADDGTRAFDGAMPNNITLTPVAQWKVMGTGVPRPNARDVVTGKHLYPSDTARPGMLYGKILRAPSYGAKMTAVDVSAAKKMDGVIVVQDGDFIGVVAPTLQQAEMALAAIEETAKWNASPHPASSELSAYLRRNARVPANPYAADVAAAAKKLKQTYNIAYIQHAPMEPRTAVAEMVDGKLTTWTATQSPTGVQSEIVRALGLANDRVRVIVPDFGGGFGGKHTGECAVEAARLAVAAKKPVWLRYTREEEFTWAYFRPAGVIDAEASLDANGTITSWHFININSGANAVATPYNVAKAQALSVNSTPPLRHGSYRGLSATANNFARECFMDELAFEAGKGPLEFRRAHLADGRLRAVLEEAAKQFDWANRVKKKEPNIGIGIACGTEKGSYVASCVEVAYDPDKAAVSVRKVCQAFECGAIVNPDNLTKQNEGAIVQGIGPALREEMVFQNGKMLNASFSKYLVPRFADVPQIQVHLINRTDLASAGAGETPLITIAPAIANAVFDAAAIRIRDMPMRLSKPKA